MKKKLLSLTAVAIVTIGVAAYAIGYEKFKINDASDYVSEYVLEFDANTNKPTNLDSAYENGTYKAYTKDHNEITIGYENASVNPNGYINLGQGGSILNPYIEGGYGNNRISSILNLTANFTGELTLSLSAVNSTTYSIKNQSLTSGELYSVTNDDQYSYFKLDASTNCSITSIEIKYSCVYVDTTVFEFVKVDGGYELSNYNGDGGDVVIPDTYLGLPVISIGNSAFEDRESLISITIPSSVTTIGDSAFENCDNLTTVTFGENSQLTSIGDSAFYNCYSLISITIPNSVTTIGDNAFTGCSSLTIYCEAASKPDGWSPYWDHSNRPVVWDCLNAKRTEDGLVYHVYGNEDGTKYIVIDTYIGTETEVVIPDTINVDGEKIKVTTIGIAAFFNCYLLTSIIIPDSVTTIGNSAFYGCSSLTSITIPDSVTTIDSSAFGDCSSLTIYCEAASKPSGWSPYWNYSNRPVVWNCLNAKTTDDGFVYHVYGNEDGTKYTEVIIPNTIVVDGEEIKVTTIGERAFYDDDTITSVTIGKNVTTIGERAFYDCNNLTTVTFGENSQLTSIGSYAFENCSNLTTVTFGENSQFTSIGSRAFYGCDSLTLIIIPDSVTSIGEWAFYGCDSLISITIPDSVTIIGEYAFYWCSNLTIYCEAASQPSGWDSWWNYSDRPVVWVSGDIFVDGDYAYVVRTSGEERYVEIVTYLGSGGEVVIPDTINFDGVNIPVTTVGIYAFSNNDTITSVTIGNNVTTIGRDAFKNCSNLTIYCEAASKPSGWSPYWNYSNRPVVWNCLNAKTTDDGFVYHVYGNEDGTKYSSHSRHDQCRW